MDGMIFFRVKLLPDAANLQWCPAGAATTPPPWPPSFSATASPSPPQTTPHPFPRDKSLGPSRTFAPAADPGPVRWTLHSIPTAAVRERARHSATDPRNPHCSNQSHRPGPTIPPQTIWWPRHGDPAVAAGVLEGQPAQCRAESWIRWTWASGWWAGIFSRLSAVPRYDFRDPFRRGEGENPIGLMSWKRHFPRTTPRRCGHRRHAPWTRRSCFRPRRRVASKLASNLMWKESPN